LNKERLPDGWKWAELGRITTITAGGTPSRGNREYWNNGTIPWVKISDITRKKITKTSEFITQKGLENSSAKIFPKGTILLSIFATLGDIGILEIDAACNQAIAGIRIHDSSKISTDYLYYYLRSLKPYFERIGRGVAQNNINQTILKQTLVPAPPLDTQRKIVAILDKAEATQRLRAEADALMWSLFENVFIKLFGNPLENPFGWRVKRLEEVSEIVSGATKGRKFNDQATTWVPYLRVANVQDGYLDLTEVKEIEVLESDVDKYALYPGDVLLTEGGDRDKLGRGAVWNGEVPLCLHQNHIFRVRVNPELLTPEYLNMLTGSTYGKMYFLKSAKQTTGIASINSTQLKNFPAYIPPLELQLKFSEIFKSIEKSRQNQSVSTNQLSVLLKSLMNNAFTGDLISN